MNKGFFLLLIFMFPLGVFAQTGGVTQAGKNIDVMAMYMAEDKGNKDISPLHEAAFNKDLAAVKKLVEAGADIEARNALGRTALMVAVKPKSDTPKPQIIRTFIARNGELTEEELVKMVGGGNDEVVAYLIEQGAQIMAKDTREQTPLHIAAQHNSSSDVIKLLLKHGAEIEAKSQHGTTPLHLAAANPVSARALIEAGANLKALDTHGNTPLYMASAFVINLKIFMEAGAEVNVQNTNGNTPLHVASHRGNLPEIALLLGYGADPFIKNRQGRRAIDSDKVQKNKKVLKYLTDQMAK